MTIRLDRITTRSGDGGTTGLSDRSRVAKTDARIEAIGTVDELNAAVGVAADTVIDPWAMSLLLEIQQQLFDLGADLSYPQRPEAGWAITEDTILELEAATATANAEVAPLTSFVLPGGPNGCGQLHVARTVCRRAERRVWAVDGDVGAAAAYLNRLSDLFFVLGRRAAAGAERLWVHGSLRRAGSTGIPSTGVPSGDAPGR